MTVAAPPRFPAGPFDFAPFTEWDEVTQGRIAHELAAVPTRLKAAIAGLGEEELDTRYNNWSIRQIVHHVADSHLNGYVRTKWALTEASPLIKSYNESKWSALADAKTFKLDSTLLILEGVHGRWSELLLQLGPTQMALTYFHPQMAREVRLIESVSNYIWHGAHHTAQIDWVRQHRLGG